MDIITKRILHIQSQTKEEEEKEIKRIISLSSFFLMFSFMIYKCLLLLLLVVSVCLANKESEMEQPTKLLGGKSITLFQPYFFWPSSSQVSYTSQKSVDLKQTRLQPSSCIIVLVLGDRIHFSKIHTNERLLSNSNWVKSHCLQQVIHLTFICRKKKAGER